MSRRPITWKVRRVRRLREPGTGVSGTVRVLPEEGGVLRFVSTAACNSEGPLVLGLVAAFSASEGIRKDTGIISWVEWPDMVTIGGKVVGRTSARVRDAPKSGAEGDGATRVAEITISVNLSPSKERAGETSLLECIGVEVDSTMLLEKILDSLSWMQFGWINGMHDRLLGRVGSMTETLGRTITVRTSEDGSRVEGVALGLDARGRLRVRLGDGRVTLLGATEGS